MGLFSRRTTTWGRGLLPADILDQLEQHGRFEFDPQGSPMTPLSVADMYHLAQADRIGFLAALRTMLDGANRWSAYGAMKLVLDVLGADLVQPDYDAVVLGGLQAMRAAGVPPIRLSMNEQMLFARLCPGERWLVGRAAPSGDHLTALVPGEVRRVAQLDGRPDSNVLFVRSDGAAGHVCLVDARQSDEDPRRSQFDWCSEPTLHELYVRIGESLQTPCYWTTVELEPYFPLPEPHF